MTDFFNFIAAIAGKHGSVVAAIIGTIIFIVYSIWFAIKNYPTIISNALAHSKEADKLEHEEAMSYRKKITPQIKKELSKLAEEIGGDRALLFEYSNGTSNLIGLPFLYATATCEVVTPQTAPVSHLYQRFSVTSMYDLIEELDEKSYYYIHNLECAKETNPILYSYLMPNGAKSVIFYALFGVSELIGFVVVTSVGEKSFTRDKALPKIAAVAQRISSILNFNEIKEDLNGNGNGKSKFWFFGSR